jgi:hypothetical protein
MNFMSNYASRASSFNYLKNKEVVCMCYKKQLVFAFFTTLITSTAFAQNSSPTGNDFITPKPQITPRPTFTATPEPTKTPMIYCTPIKCEQPARLVCPKDKKCEGGCGFVCEQNPLFVTSLNYTCAITAAFESLSETRIETPLQDGRICSSEVLLQDSKGSLSSLLASCEIKEGESACSAKINIPGVAKRVRKAIAPASILSDAEQLQLGLIPSAGFPQVRFELGNIKVQHRYIGPQLMNKQ